MILVSLALVLVVVAAVTLVIGTFFGGGVAYTWISIGACVAAFGVLAASYSARRRRGRSAAGEGEATPGPGRRDTAGTSDTASTAGTRGTSGRAGTRGTRARAVLSQIRGVGPAKQHALLERFGSLEHIAEADVEDLARVRGVDESVAAAIKRALQDR